VLHFFGGGGNGSFPSAGLIFDAAGNLYGTTAFAGAYGAGTVFELTPAGGGSWTETVLHNFNHNGTDGAYPAAGLVFDASGNLYGTTSQGGTFDCGGHPDYGCGTVFELSPTPGGGWTEKVLHSFNDNGVDGYIPGAGLILDAAGNLYGTTEYGGAGDCVAYPTIGCGTVFELTPAGGGQWTETVLYSFANNGMDGTYPIAGLIFNAAGNLYGTTSEGGTYDVGTVFALTPTPAGAWTETVLHSFDSSCSQGGCADGYLPAAGLILDAAGDLYSTTFLGGANNLGTVFELMPTEGGGWTEALLYDFCSQTDCMDGAEPEAGLIFDASGNLYGTTTRTSLGNSGTVFELSPVYPCINCSHATLP
jgi:uncharacterized repeat protein (TIGR03803 family)